MTTKPLAKAVDTGPSLQKQRARAAFWFLAPMLAALFCVAAWPLLRTIRAARASRKSMISTAGISSASTITSTS